MKILCGGTMTNYTQRNKKSDLLLQVAFVLSIISIKG